MLYTGRNAIRTCYRRVASSSGKCLCLVKVQAMSPRRPVNLPLPHGPLVDLPRDSLKLKQIELLLLFLSCELRCYKNGQLDWTVWRSTCAILQAGRPRCGFLRSELERGLCRPQNWRGPLWDKEEGALPHPSCQRLGPSMWFLPPQLSKCSLTTSTKGRSFQHWLAQHPVQLCPCQMPKCFLTVIP